jgi:hypothetical protein
MHGVVPEIDVGNLREIRRRVLGTIPRLSLGLVVCLLYRLLSAEGFCIALVYPRICLLLLLVSHLQRHSGDVVRRDFYADNYALPVDLHRLAAPWCDASVGNQRSIGEHPRTTHPSSQFAVSSQSDQGSWAQFEEGCVVCVVTGSQSLPPDSSIWCMSSCSHLESFGNRDEWTTISRRKWRWLVRYISTNY